MTRGKVLFIDNNGQLYSSTEFNGDMYPEGNGNEVIESFMAGFFEDYSHFIRFVELFNKHHFGYESELLEELSCDKHIISIKDNLTDYLYIINTSVKEWIIIDKHGNPSYLTANTMAIVYYKEVERLVHRCIEETFIFNSNELECEEFVSIIDRLRETSDLVDKVDELFRNSRENIENDFCNAAGLQISHESVVVKLLKKLMHDKHEWIDYFIYELDYGRNYEPGMIKEADGTNIDLSSAEALYGYLKSYCENKRGE
ncbi:MAG: hypothetical protein MJ105_09760 [Lachnospiraceae bacterium]|nr:hypothetical protein [Lachnospiraceae bacterium]